jgi:cyclase
VRRVSRNAYTEVYFWGCNPSFLATSDGVFMIDTPQQPIDAVRWRERLLEHGPIRHLVNTEPHPDHIRGNAYFPGVEVIGQRGMVDRYAQALPMMTGEQTLEAIKAADPDSVWLFNHPDYPPNPPTRPFDDRLGLRLGDHEIQLIHHPGHTPPQTSVYVPQEGVVFTGDNVFYHCKSFIQEADPWQWLEALRQIGELDVETIVPGHGEPCDKRYLATQAEIIQNWVGLVEDYVRRGLSEDEAVRQPLDARTLDPYPIGQRLFERSDWVTERNIRNIYQHVQARLRRADAAVSGQRSGTAAADPLGAARPGPA